jgi:hypothetical protein
MTGTNTAELAYRATDGVEVSLLWSKRCRRLTVVVSDSRAAQSFELTAHPENALDVFHHPYAYAAAQGII